MSKRDYPDYPPQRIRKHRLVVGDATFIVSSNVDDNKRWIREVHHVRRHRKGGSAEVSIYPNGGRKPSAALASLWAHLGIDPDARWKECAADHPAFPAKRSIRTAMDAVDDARKNAAAAAVLAASGWTWADGGAGHWEAPPAQAVDLGTGVKAIAAERERQLQAEGFTRDGDQQYRHGELARAATAYVQLAAMDLAAGGTRDHIAWHGPAAVWPWAPEWWKPVDARRDLVRAGALIAAQIDLIDSQAVGNG